LGSEDQEQDRSHDRSQEILVRVGFSQGEIDGREIEHLGGVP
jgi:hypothetical protein